ncbi:MAG: tetratricopeptide repeat protein [Planctomycetota bacterium]
MSEQPERFDLSPRYLVYLLLLVALELSLTWGIPDADPPLGYEPNPAVLEQGYRDLHESRGDASLSTCELAPEPTASSLVQRARGVLCQWPRTRILEAFGTSVPAARGLGALGSILCVVLGAEVVRRRFGVKPALLAALILASHPAWHAIVRSPTETPWVAFWLLLSFAGVTSRSVPVWTSGASIGALAWLLHPSLLVLLPAWLIEVGTRRSAAGPAPGGGWLLVVISGVALALGYGAGRCWGGIPSLADLLEFERASGFFTAYPFLLSWAWVGTLLALAAIATPDAAAGPQNRFRRSLHVTIWLGLPVVVLAGGGTVTALSVFVPLLVVAVVATVAQLTGALAEVRRGSPGQWVLWVVAALPTAYGLVQLRVAAGATEVPYTADAILAAGGAVLVLAVLRSSPTRRRVPVQWSFVTLMWLVAAAPRDVAMFAVADQSLRRANAQLAALVLPTARLAGPSAHALAVENGLTVCVLPHEGVDLRDHVERHGVTHLLLDHPRWDMTQPRALLATGLHLESIETLGVRGRPIHLYRVDREARRSAFETAILARQRQLRTQAESWFLLVATRWPAHAPSWVQLSQLALEGCAQDRLRARVALALSVTPSAIGCLGQLVHAAAAWKRHEIGREYARECLSQAMRADPRSVSGLMGLYDWYDHEGYEREALYYLRLAVASEPGNEVLRTLLARREERALPFPSEMRPSR